MNWSSRLFFFILLAYAVYVFSAGDAGKWKQIFTQKATKAQTPGNPSIGSTIGSLAGGLAGQTTSPLSPTQNKLLGSLAG